MILLAVSATAFAVSVFAFYLIAKRGNATRMLLWASVRGYAGVHVERGKKYQLYHIQGFRKPVPLKPQAAPAGYEQIHLLTPESPFYEGPLVYDPGLEAFFPVNPCTLAETERMGRERREILGRYGEHVESPVLLMEIQ